jgi:hypothetical protein
MKVRLICAVAVLALLAVLAGSWVGHSNGANNVDQNVELVYNGPSIANTHAAPTTPDFTSWCSLNGPCFPSVMLPVSDATTGQPRGTIYVWTKNFVSSADGKSICFGEFIWYALNEGDIYTSSGSNGTCGGNIDPALKAPTHIAGPGVVIAGGGDGTIVGGGTGRFSKWTGTYTDRVFVEIGGGGNYYDQLWFSLNGRNG